MSSIKTFRELYSCISTAGPNQVDSELEDLFIAVNALNPKVVLEIGVEGGGTAFFWCSAIDSSGLFIGIDSDPKISGVLSILRKSFPDISADIVIQNSTSEYCKKDVITLLNDRPVDFLFIDGDHSYEGVSSDYRMYAPLVRPGGIIAFHDIMPLNGGPARLWREIENPSKISVIKAKDPLYGIGYLTA